MQIDKSQIIDMLRQRGDQSQAAEAESQLPDQIDPQEHAGLLGKFGLDPQELISKFAGGSGGGIGGAVGDAIKKMTN